MSLVVTLETGVDPPADVSLLPPELTPPGHWGRFSTSHGYALVFHPDDVPSYIVHAIEVVEHQRSQGHGTILMEAINAWADENGYAGSLLCRADLVPWYEARGWTPAAEFFGDVIMSREVQG